MKVKSTLLSIKNEEMEQNLIPYTLSKTSQDFALEAATIADDEQPKNQYYSSIDPAIEGNQVTWRYTPRSNQWERIDNSDCD